jgi:hypothetical protein
VKFVPGQLKNILDLTEETFRHWRKVLPALSHRKGKTAKFSVADVMALKLIQQLSQDVGIKIGRLAPISTSIFEICSNTPYIKLQRGCIAIDMESNTAKFYDKNDVQLDGQLLLIIDCAPLTQSIQDHFFESVEEQQQLPFPPARVRNR